MTKDTRIFRDKNFVGFERLELSSAYQIQSSEFRVCRLTNAFTEFEFHSSGKFLGRTLECKCQMLFNVNIGLSMVLSFPTAGWKSLSTGII